MKGSIRIGGALALGIIIIFGALYVKNTHGTEASGEISVAPAPPRTYIENEDGNKNGTPDWEEALQANVFQTISTSTKLAETSSEAYVPPTTFTGKFSEAFFQDYLQGKISGADFSDPSKFVGTAVEAIDKNTRSAGHLRLELTLVPVTEESMHTYGNSVVEIIKKNSIENEHEMVILQRALKENDPKILEALEPIRLVYVRMIADTLVIDVPENFAQAHIDLLNAYEKILADIGAAQRAFTDPLYSLARVRLYDKDAEALASAYAAIAELFSQEGIVYANDELGTMFQLFEKP